MSDWDGKERRSIMFDKNLYDKIMETHSDVKHIAEWAKKHDEEDITRFSLVTKEIDMGKRVLWIGVGVLATLNLALKFLQ